MRASPSCFKVASSFVSKSNAHRSALFMTTRGSYLLAKSLLPGNSMCMKLCYVAKAHQTSAEHLLASDKCKKSVTCHLCVWQVTHYATVCRNGKAMPNRMSQKADTRPVDSASLSTRRQFTTVSSSKQVSKEIWMLAGMALTAWSNLLRNCKPEQAGVNPNTLFKM